MPYYYDKQNRPITLDKWVELRSIDSEYFKVARSEICGFLVITVWIGMNFAPVGKPFEIFETMVFPPPKGEERESGDYIDEYSMRYATEQEALVGHELACEVVRRNVASNPGSRSLH